MLQAQWMEILVFEISNKLKPDFPILLSTFVSEMEASAGMNSHQGFDTDKNAACRRLPAF